MYQGLGAPYVMGSGGAIVDCGQWANVLQPACWNPFAQTYSMLDYTTQSGLGPAAGPSTQTAVAADTQATIQQQCAADPSDCTVASSDSPFSAAAVAGAQQAASNLAGEAASNLAGAIPVWLWALLIGGGALLLFTAVRR
jgi:hypothetical protein